MRTELVVSDLHLTTDEITEQVFKAVKYPLDGVSVGQSHLSAVRDVVPVGLKFRIASTVDPFGHSDKAVRNHGVVSAIRRGATTVDLCIYSKLAAEQKYFDLYQETKSNFEICLANNVQMRLIVDYHYFSEAQIRRISDMAMNLGVYELILSGRQLPDSLVDCLILAHTIRDKTGIKVWINTDFWKDSDLFLVEQSEVFGIRVSEFTLLSNILPKSKLSGV